MAVVFPEFSFTGDPVTYIAPSWVELEVNCFQLSQKILADNQTFDRVITLAKGGWPMTRSLVDFLQIKEVASLGIKFYKGVDQRFDEPVVYQDLPISVAGESVLLFDDVADTGLSLKYAKEYLLEKGVSSVKTATQFYKPSSVVKPDYFQSETTHWIIFPFEIIESIKQLKTLWQEKGVTPEEQKERLLAMKLNNDVINTYFDIL